MKKSLKTGLFIALSSFAMTAMAADPLAGTQWTTYDGGKAKSIIKITESNNKLSGTIVKILDARANGKTVCDACQGKFHNKPLTGAVIFSGLTPKGDGTYDGGSITDPETGKTYSMSATAKGSSLEVRGYMGVKALGRSQTWKKK